LAASWNREAICVARRVKKSAPLLTTFTIFGVANGEPIFRHGKRFSVRPGSIAIAGRMRRGIEMQNSPPIMLDDKEAIEYAER
jgi:hypothetical protein